MNKILPSILISLGINFHILSSMAAEPLQDIGAKDSLVSSEIDHHINCLMFCLFETKVKVGENSILRSKNPAEIALFLKSIKTLRKKLCFVQPRRLQDKLKRFGFKSNIKKDDVCNEPFLLF